MLISDLISECALHIGDPLLASLNKEQWLMFIQSASRDLDSAGWLLPANDDTSLVGAANTYTYAIPQPFAYLRELRQEQIVSGQSSYTRPIPSEHWEPRLEAGIPVLFFFSISTIDVGKKIMLNGQRRPSAYSTIADTVDPGVEGFLRERAVGYAARYLGGGGSELARWRQVIAGEAMQASERTLRLMPQEFRQWPSTRIVYGRERR